MPQSITHNNLPSSLLNLPISSSLLYVASIHTSAVVERARQSTRLRKRKVYLANKKKKDERLRKNPPPIPHKVQLMLKAKGFGSEPLDWRKEDTRPFPTDDVWCERFFTHNRLSVPQALECLREHYDPTMLNNPDGIIMARVEFNMATAKNERYMDGFSKMIPLFNAFERGVSEKTILVFAKNEDALHEAREAGAERAGGLELVDDIAKGKVEVLDYDYFLAHDDIILELKPLLGILRDKFPKKQTGTAGSDLAKLVKTFTNGQMVDVKKPKSTLGYKDDPSFGFSEAMVGRLGMPDHEIQENLDTLLDNLRASAPAKKSNQFISRLELFVEGPLKSKFTVHHDVVNDVRYKNHMTKHQSIAE